MKNPVTLEVFSDYVWPWCYLSTGRIERLREQYDLTIVWTHFPLHPETPVYGISLEELFAGRNVDIETMQARMKVLMAGEALPYGDRTHTYNSRLAQELGKWADTQELGDEFHDAMFRSYFVEGRNIGDVDTLVQIAVQVGLSDTEARAVLTERTFKVAIDTDWQRSRAVGVTGVPTFVADRRRVVGAQPYEALEQLITLAGAARQSGEP